MMNDIKNKKINVIVAFKLDRITRSVFDKEYVKIKKEVKYLRNRNNKLKQDKDKLISYIQAILKAIKHFLENYYKLVMTK